MRRFYFVPLLAAFMAVGCDDDNPTQPSELTPTFQMNLLASNEVPAIQSPDTEATCAGTVTIRLNITRDASNTITAATVDFQGNITGCPTTTTITNAHIHEQVAGQNGSVKITAFTSSTFSVPLVNGAGSFTRNSIPPDGTPPDLSVIQRILDNPSGFYFNIHTSAHPGGVIRAQLVRVQ
jgi:CHRD domain-containing protein